MPTPALFKYGGVVYVQVGDLVKYKNGVVNFSGIVVEVLSPHKVNVCFHWDGSLYTNSCNIHDLTVISSIEIRELFGRPYTHI